MLDLNSDSNSDLIFGVDSNKNFDFNTSNYDSRILSINARGNWVSEDHNRIDKSTKKLKTGDVITLIFNNKTKNLEYKVNDNEYSCSFDLARALQNKTDLSPYYCFYYSNSEI